MLYDHANRPIEGSKTTPPADGKRLVTWEPQDRYGADASRGLSPVRLDSIFSQANSGDPREQARLAREIEEKDWDSIQALQTRRAAVLGLEKSIRPKKSLEKDSKARKVADEIFQSLEEEVLHGIIQNTLTGLLSGYSCQELVWADGGRTVVAADPIDTSFIKFINSREPMIVSTNSPEGRPLAPYKFIFHRHAAMSGDPARGGLIRPLGWMFLFSMLGVKDLVRFVEKFGMPFVSARVDENVWEQERGKLISLIRNFGSDGGAIFTKAVELEFIDAAQNNGEVYFKLMDYFAAAKTKVILGQTATSGDAGGFSKGQAQSEVRQDILRNDCMAISATLRRDLLAPITMFRFGPDAPVPEIEFEIEEPEDLEKKSIVVKNLSDAGYESDDQELSAEFGMTLRKKAAQEPPLALSDRRMSRTAQARAAGIAAQAANEKIVATAMQDIVKDVALAESWLGPVANAIAEALAGLPEKDPTPADVAAFSDRLGALLDGIPALRKKMDTAALEEKLTQAMFAADTNGRLAVATK